MDSTLPKGRRPIRYQEIAQAAGVSPATVSRAINSPNLVRKELRMHILATARNLGYLPHGAARALATRRSHTLGAVVPTLNNPFFTRQIDVFQSRIEESGYVLLLTSSEYDPEREVVRVRALLERGVDGLMLVGAEHDERLFKLVADSGIPYVLTSGPPGADLHPAICHDNHGVAVKLVEHLTALGHREFAVIVGDFTHNDRVRARVAGTLEALASANINLTDERILYTKYTVADARDIAEHLLRRPSRPTAIIAGNDVIGIGVMLGAAAAGVRVPQDLSVVGFGDLDFAAAMQPSLTTARVPMREAGRLAAEYLLARIDGRTFDLPRVLPAEIIIRESTGPAPGTLK